MTATNEPSAFDDRRAEIVSALLDVNRVFVAVATTALAGLAPDVTLPQFRTLVLVEERGPMTVTALAEALGVVPSTATRMCDRLVAKKLVRRAVDRRNRRRVTISLGEQGRALIAESTARRRRELAGLLDNLPAGDRGRVAEALRLLVAAAGTRSAS
ncbi:MAG: MarR family winged helix-turn-helix transcriptional regulator [Sciscionella sp.]